KNVRPDSISYYYNATRIRQLSPAQRAFLDSLCYKAPDINDSALYVFSAGYRRYLSDLIQHSMYKMFRAEMQARMDQPLVKMKVAQKLFSNPYIRNRFAYEYTSAIIKMAKDSTLKDSIYHAFMAQSSDAAQRTQIEVVYKNYKTYADNKPAPEFSFVSAAGKQVSLKNLRGKFVYIDVWATWCGPCKKEIPWLTKIEEEYQGKNIHFVSLSVDVPADKNKWLDYVNSNHLKGIQLMADNAFESAFIKSFNINSIPRFILLSPDGTIIRADAKRPSDPELKAQLDALL
ncbi:MAG: TlpA family protein disulfide reductase, partial [Bacteroidetes bacterium]|nr:TlpA family protein disulfide reductase [Bacteroidota bacterium]